MTGPAPRKEGRNVAEFAELSGWLTDRFGGRWVPVRFLGAPPVGSLAGEIRFCEAIREAACSCVVLTAETAMCPGAKRSFGWAGGMDEGLAESMARRQGMPLAVARELIRATPRLDDGIQAVEIGGKGQPDLVLSYATPLSAIKVVRAVEVETGGVLAQRLSSALSVCGSVAARCAKTGEVSVSFGCAESREAAGLGRDALAVGIPWAFVERLSGKAAPEDKGPDATSRARVAGLDGARGIRA